MLDRPCPMNSWFEIDMLPGAQGERACDGYGFGQREQRHGERHRAERGPGLKIETRRGQGRQARRQFANRPDRAGIAELQQAIFRGHLAAGREFVKEIAGRACGQHRADHVGPAGEIALDADGRDDGDNSDNRGLPGGVAQMGPHILHDLVEREAARHAVQLEKVLELVGGDNHARARGEADDNRVRYEVDERAEPEQAHGQFDHADKEGERERQDHVMVRSGRRNGTERRGHDQRSRHRRPRNQLPGRAEQRGHDCRDHAGVEAVNRRHAGDGRVGDALREHHERAGQRRPEIGIQGVRVDMRRPAQKRQQAPLPGYCAVTIPSRHRTPTRATLNGACPSVAEDRLRLPGDP